MTASAATPTGSDAFNCKGGSTTAFLLAFVLGDAPALAGGASPAQDSPVAFARLASLSEGFSSPVAAEIRNLAIISSRIGSVSDNFSSHLDEEISRSLEFIESIQTKFKEIGTTDAKAKNETLAGQASPLVQKAGELNTRTQGLVADLDRIRTQFLETRPLVLKQVHNHGTPPSLNPLRDSLATIEKQLTQVRLEQATLRKSLDVIEKTGINLLPEAHKAPFINQRDERERRGPS